MASEAHDLAGHRQGDLSSELASQWRRLTWAATGVALLTAPAVAVWLEQTQGWSWFWSIVAALTAVVVFRGLVDLLFHRAIPRPSLFGLESPQLREEDVVARRRVWFWRFWVKAAIVATSVFLERSDVRSELSRPLVETFTSPLTPGIGEIAGDELQTVDRITRSRLYSYGYLQAQDGSPVMVLSPAASS